jgi:hypothetical protein
VRSIKRYRVIDANRFVNRAKSRHGSVGRSVQCARIREFCKALKPARHRTLDQHARAVANPHRHFIARARREAKLREERVYSNVNVLDRVDERSVEIEENGVWPRKRAQRLQRARMT